MLLGPRPVVELCEGERYAPPLLYAKPKHEKLTQQKHPEHRRVKLPETAQVNLTFCMFSAGFRF